jgi:hypothetical protein
LEQFDQVAGGVGKQDLTAAGAGDHVTAKRQAGSTLPLDLGVEVLDDQVDAVAPGNVGVGWCARAPELAGPDSSSRSGPRTTSAKAGAALVFSRNPRWSV